MELISNIVFVLNNSHINKLSSITTYNRNSNFALSVSLLWLIIILESKHYTDLFFSLTRWFNEEGATPIPAPLQDPCIIWFLSPSGGSSSEAVSAAFSAADHQLKLFELAVSTSQWAWKGTFYPPPGKVPLIVFLGCTLIAPVSALVLF